VAEATRGYAHRIDVQAPLDELWRSMVEPGRLALWYARGVRTDARAGGNYELPHERGVYRVAHIDVFDPGRRLRLIYMAVPQFPPCESVIVDDFIFGTEGGNAVLRLLGSGVPHDEAWDVLYARIRNDWGRALARLKVLTEREARSAGAAKL
jgi:hypothetical protein